MIKKHADEVGRIYAVGSFESGNVPTAFAGCRVV
jgi:hypothetical protein